LFGFSPPRTPGFDTVETVHALEDGHVDVFVALAAATFAMAVPTPSGHSTASSAAR